jgi:membrane-bound serine protease (ClpP class)
MTVWQRIVLFLLALPFSAALAVGVVWGAGLALTQGLAVTAVVFIASELLLNYFASKIPPRTGPETLPGQEVEVISDFATDQGGSCTGYVRVHGERWRARATSPSAGMTAGHRVRIERVEGLTLWVSAARYGMEKDAG